MKRLVIGMLALLVAGGAVWAFGGVSAGLLSAPAVTAGGSHTCDVDFSVNYFTSLSGWTQDACTWSIISGSVRGEDWTTCVLRNNTQTEAEYQWGKFKVAYLVESGAGSYFEGIALRMTGSTGYRYVVGLEWTGSAHYLMWKVVNGTTTVQTVQSQSITLAQGDVFAARVTGTGSSTVIDIWKNPSGTCPDDWGTPTWTFTNDPTNSADTGTYVGIFSERDNSCMEITDVAGGD